MIPVAESAIIARLSAALAPGSVLVGSFDDVDLTDDGSGPVIGQIRLERINTLQNVRGSAARIQLVYSFCVYCDVQRSDSSEKTAALQMLADSGNSLVAWTYVPGITPEIVDGPDSVFDGRVLRIGFAFTLETCFSG